MKYVKGDLFDVLDQTTKSVVIPHITNDIGAWGSGFVVALSNRWPYKDEKGNINQCSPEAQYRLNDPVLGEAHLAMPECRQHDEDTRSVIYVANMCAQTGIMGMSTGPRSKVNKKPIRYEALSACMTQVSVWVQSMKNIGMDTMILAPKFGSLRAGGDWKVIEKMIQDIWDNHEVVIVEYE